MTTFLIISPESWDAHTVSKHHYAMTLADFGYRVVFLDPPSGSSQPLTFSRPEHGRDILVVKGGPVARGLRFMPASLARRLQASWLKRLEQKIGFQIDVVWLFENSRFYDLSFAGARLKIYHQVDLNQNFYPVVAAKSADVTFCTTDIIKARLSKSGVQAHKIHHGTVEIQSPIEPDITRFSQGKINAVYIGNLNMAYIDSHALARVAAANPDTAFHFVGNYDRSTPLFLLCDGLDNVHWWGKVSFREIPNILKQADILLVAYLRQYHQDQASPHKFMEYFLSGKVVVCSYTDEYKDKRHLVEMAASEDDIDAIFSRVAGDLSQYNSPKLAAARRAFALDHTYERQLTRILDIVRETTGYELNRDK